MKLNACHNRQPFKPSTLVQDGWMNVDNTRLPKMVEMPFRMSKDCQYQRDPMRYGQKDQACTGCKHKEAHEA